MEILEILNNLVCRDHVFSFLKVNDLLRLRGVSKTFKNEAEDFIRIKKVTTKRLLVLCGNDSSRELNNFKNSLCDLPMRTEAHVEFVNNGGKFRMLGKLHQNFTHTYSTSITHLNLVELKLPLYSASEVQFFDQFLNIAHLSIGMLYLSFKGEIPSQGITIPASLRKLKSLEVRKFGTDFTYAENQREVYFNFLAKLVETCIPTLEQLQFPYENQDLAINQVMRMICKCLFSYPKLKLEGVNGHCIQDLLKPNRRTQEMRTVNAMISKMNDKIISIIDPQSKTFSLELPNLERISFFDMYECMLPDDLVRQDWPKLKKIYINLRSCPNPTDFWKFLFGNGIKRENMISLTINFKGFEEENIASAREQTLARTLDLISSCPNLKILCLCNDIKQVVNLPKLWEGLPLLEDVCLRYCNDLADSDFIGNDPKNPVFWNLKDLKTLKLERIDGPHLTNALLSSVICHMPIQSFTLSSDWSNSTQHSIGSEGTKGLLTEPFASTTKNLFMHDFNIRPVSLLEKVNAEWDKINFVIFLVLNLIALVYLFTVLAP